MFRVLHKNRRSKDVLFALEAASNHKQFLGRLALQKFIYLFDVLAIAWRRVGAQGGFRPWHNGPYDASIQNTVDSLAFRGLVNISGLSFSKAKRAECRYTLSETGRLATKALLESRAFRDDLDLYWELANEINRRGWKHIKEIVYSEPNYDAARMEGTASCLSLHQSSENMSWQLIRDLCYSFEQMSDKPMSRRTLVQVFFAILDENRLSTEPKLLG